jgi:hypothetical protein
MKTLKQLLVGLVVMTVLVWSGRPVYAQQSVAGDWTMSVQGMSLRLVMAQNGEKISGTLESPHGEIRLTGDFTKGKLTLSGASTEEHPIQFAGTALLTAEGGLAGTMSVNQMELAFTAVRSREK